ncbi:uncharacterized protein LOC6551015 [Drosophila erecta]|uniref:Uncharacterized protein n=1 Tax=Drosophila erecta TaxID=7220 RepID=B3NWN1_DROER|nr:uncharacterized protein LOC6551015 [Drosophila erecta]EDV47193.2 uncharacterized protein Dere_GG17786 [Drosophila erecta]
MPSNQCHLLQLHLLLCALLLTSGQRTPARVPPRILQVPNFGGESFERFDAGSASTSSSGSSESQETSDEMREQLKQLLGNQLATAFAPLATTPPFTRRQPAIASPSSGAAARSQFATDPDQDQDQEAESPEQDGEEEEQPEEEQPEEEQEEGTPQPQPLPPALPQPGGAVEELAGGQAGEHLEDYNAWRDNFYELNEDGSYIFGYSIPHGIRRWEKGYYSEEQHGRVVEGFYVQPRHDSQGLSYELRCYRADSEGYQPMPVQFLRTPPIVERDVVPRVDCFQNGRE